jgi:hypothetical protein
LHVNSDIYDILMHNRMSMLRFSAWIVCRCAQVYSFQYSLEFRNGRTQLFWLTLNLYADGLRARPHRRIREITPCLLPTSTFYRLLAHATKDYDKKIVSSIRNENLVKVIWIDNFARHFAA